MKYEYYYLSDDTHNDYNFTRVRVLRGELRTTVGHIFLRATDRDVETFLLGRHFGIEEGKKLGRSELQKEFKKLLNI